MGLRKEVLETVGGWDERMGWGHEEKELADRVLEQHDIYYNPEMVVDHVYAESMLDFWSKQYRLHRRTPYYLRKRGATTSEIVLSTLRKLLDPRGYLRRSVPLTVAQSGATVAGVAGRIVGMADGHEPVPDSPSSTVDTGRGE